jgi:hypothetical protein
LDAVPTPVLVEIKGPSETSNTHLLVCFYLHDELWLRWNRVHDKDVTFATGDEQNVPRNVMNHGLET